jgi:hypothetical protein
MAAGSRFYFQSSYDAELSRQTDGTCDWLLEDELFSTWANALCPSILWVTGGSSTGKSVAMAYAVNRLLARELPLQVPQYDTIYFFCSQSAKDSNRSDSTAVIRSLLFQLWRVTKEDSQLKEIWKTICLNQDALDIERDKRSYWSRLLHLVVSKLSKPLYLIVDGVDECDHPALLLSELQKLISGHDGIKIFFSSRPAIQDVVQFLKNVPTIEISKIATDKDIRCHIRHRFTDSEYNLSQLPFQFTDGFKKEIEDTLIRKANGMYILHKAHLLSNTYLGFCGLVGISKISFVRAAGAQNSKSDPT